MKKNVCENTFYKARIKGSVIVRSWKMRGSLMNKPKCPGERLNDAFKSMVYQVIRIERSKTRKDFTNGEEVGQIGSQEPGNEKRSLQKHYFFKTGI